jgi:superfamily II DNA/RNA helicase
LLFSATMPNWVKEIVEEHMRSDYRVVDLAQDLKNKTAKNVKHLAVECPWHNRIDVLSRIGKLNLFMI